MALPSALRLVKKLPQVRVFVFQILDNAHGLPLGLSDKDLHALRGKDRLFQVEHFGFIALAILDHSHPETVIDIDEIGLVGTLLL